MNPATFLVVDNFHSDPVAVRELALKQEYVSDNQWYKGGRSKERFLFDGLREEFERLLQKKITRWTEHGQNGRFQIYTSGDAAPIHCDEQSYAAIHYLTPNAPPSAGTRFLRSRLTGLHRSPTTELACKQTFVDPTFLDPTIWEVCDEVANRWNRLLLFDGRLIHQAGDYFGHDLQSGRLTHLYFFSTD